MRLLLTDPARAQLDDLLSDWRQVSPGAAARWLGDLRAAFRRLRRFPMLGHAFDNDPKSKRRILDVAPFRVAYIVRDDTIVVVAFRHQRRRPE